MQNESLYALLEAALREDIGEGDHSTLSCIPEGKKGRAILKIKQPGILAGMEVARYLFGMMEPGAQFTEYKKDGDGMKAGDSAFEIGASMRTILGGERLVLNCMQRMSGIATLTHTYAEKLKGYHTRLLDTRKTTPNFRLLEKEAVRIGGGINHRMGLYDMIMLKDNHIDYCGGLETAINRAHAYAITRSPQLKIEVETRSLEEVKKVCEIGVGKVFRIMLDNFTPPAVYEAVQLVSGRFETEASGGIHLDTLVSFAETGVDYVSVGGLIHQAQSLDMSLKAGLN